MNDYLFIKASWNVVNARRVARMRGSSEDP
jgi:hypothetical protein